MRKLAPRLACFLVWALGTGASLGAQPAPGGLGLAEAVRLTLQHDPNVALLETREQAARGTVEVASGAFDSEVTALVMEGESREPGSPASSTLDSTVSLTHPFRSGLSLEPELRLERSREAGAPGAAGNSGTFTFRVRQPLLRGRGWLANGAEEAAARLDLAATGWEVRHEVARRVLTVASQYWTVAAAVRDLEVLRASETSARELLETTRRLIEADQVPAAEQVQTEANLAAQESATIGGERQLFAERQDLGLEIGLTAAEIAALPLPADPFPELRVEELPSRTVAEGWLLAARERRADLRAAAARREGAELRRRSAALALQPKLDLVLAPSYSGREEGAGVGSYFAPLYRDVPGLSTSVTLDLGWPLRNRRAEGTLVLREAAVRASAALYEQAARAIDALVPAAFDAVARDARRREKAREAVMLFERAVTNEEKKLRAGTSTLINLISQRDRLTGARQAEVRAELALALSLLQLRFETGTLFGAGGEGEGDAAEAGARRLTTLPDPPPGGDTP